LVLTVSNDNDNNNNYRKSPEIVKAQEKKMSLFVGMKKEEAINSGCLDLFNVCNSDNDNVIEQNEFDLYNKIYSVYSEQEEGLFLSDDIDIDIDYLQIYEDYYKKNNPNEEFSPLLCLKSFINYNKDSYGIHIEDNHFFANYLLKHNISLSDISNDEIACESVRSLSILTQDKFHSAHKNDDKKSIKQAKFDHYQNLCNLCGIDSPIEINPEDVDFDLKIYKATTLVLAWSEAYLDGKITIDDIKSQIGGKTDIEELIKNNDVLVYDYIKNIKDGGIDIDFLRSSFHLVKDRVEFDRVEFAKNQKPYPKDRQSTKINEKDLNYQKYKENKINERKEDLNVLVKNLALWESYGQNRFNELCEKSNDKQSLTEAERSEYLALGSVKKWYDDISKDEKSFSNLMKLVKELDKSELKTGEGYTLDISEIESLQNKLDEDYYKSLEFSAKMAIKNSERKKLDEFAKKLGFDSWSAYIKENESSLIKLGGKDFFTPDKIKTITNAIESGCQEEINNQFNTILNEYMEEYNISDRALAAQEICIIFNILKDTKDTKDYPFLNGLYSDFISSCAQSKDDDMYINIRDIDSASFWEKNLVTGVNSDIEGIMTIEKIGLDKLIAWGENGIVLEEGYKLYSKYGTDVQREALQNYIDTHSDLFSDELRNTLETNMQNASSVLNNTESSSSTSDASSGHVFERPVSESLPFYVYNPPKDNPLSNYDNSLVSNPTKGDTTKPFDITTMKKLSKNYDSSPKVSTTNPNRLPEESTQDYVIRLESCSSSQILQNNDACRAIIEVLTGIADPNQFARLCFSNEAFNEIAMNSVARYGEMIRNASAANQKRMEQLTDFDEKNLA